MQVYGFLLLQGHSTSSKGLMVEGRVGGGRGPIWEVSIRVRDSSLKEENLAAFGQCFSRQLVLYWILDLLLGFVNTKGQWHCLINTSTNMACLNHTQLTYKVVLFLCHTI